MKSQRGVTLISLTVYIIGLTIMLAILTVISSFFHKNVDENIAFQPLAERTKFNSFFTEEVNHKNIEVKECNRNYIVFSNGVQYTFIWENKGIYRNKVKICREVNNCYFKSRTENGKNIIEVTLQIGNSEETVTKYVLQNQN